MTNKRSVTSKKRREISQKGYYGSESEKSLRSDKLRGTVSSSMVLRNIGSSRPEVPKIENKRTAVRSTTKTILHPFVASRNSTNFPSFGVPKDAAVHFGNFYRLGIKSGNNGAVGRTEEGTSESELPVRDSPRSEFTRQMVHKLERLAGTEYYARQISELLEETVESPNYVQPPDDNFLPYERSDLPSYPLWYKDPDKMKSMNCEELFTMTRAVLTSRLNSSCNSYRSPNNESSSSIETRDENVRTSKEMLRLTESATSSDETINLINATTGNIDSRTTFDITDYDDNNNYDSSSISSDNNV